MKTKFFELVKEVNEAGIAVALCNASNADEIRAAWKKFEEENSDLFTRITDWAAEFAGIDDCGVIFEDGAEVEMPIEIAVCIYIMGEDLTECEIFESNSDFVEALCDIGEENAETLGNIVAQNYLYSITPEDIFNYEGEEETDDGEDADADESEAGDSDDGEDATEDDAAEAEDSDDGDETEIVSEDADADESEAGDSDDGEDATEDDAAEAEDSDDGDETETESEDADADESEEGDSDDGEDATEDDVAETEDSDDGDETEIVSEDADADESEAGDSDDGEDVTEEDTAEAADADSDYDA